MPGGEALAAQGVQVDVKVRWSAGELADHGFLLGAAAVHKIVPLIRAAREQKEAKKKKPDV